MPAKRKKTAADSQKAADAARIDTENFLASRPVRNEAMQVNRRKDGSGVISVPLRRPPRAALLRLILPVSTHSRVELDQVGMAVLDLCDGENTVETVVEKFAAMHKLSFREAQLPVAQFLQQMTQRGIVAIVGTQEPSPE